MLSSGGTLSWSAPLLVNQSDLVWKRETESPLALTAERCGGRMGWGGVVFREDFPLEGSGAMSEGEREGECLCAS